MRLKPLEKDKKYIWTNHALQKMRFYRLSESRVRRILRNPERTEDGVAPDTIASMQPAGSKKLFQPASPELLRCRRRFSPILAGDKQAQGKGEIWVMWQKNKKMKIKNEKQQFKSKNHGNSKKIIIISAWRYPGISPINKPIKIPEDVLEDLRSSGLIS